MLLSAVSVLVVAQSSSEIPKGFMNNPVFYLRFVTHMKEKINSNQILAGKTQGRNLADLKYKNRFIVEF